MRKLIIPTIAIGLAAALQPAAHAQFGSGIVFDPTQSGHAIVQIEHEEQSLANEAQQIENGTKIFTNTVKIATTALQMYNTVQQQYNLYHQMVIAPTMLYQRFLSPRSDLMLMQQISNTYGNSMGWLNASNTGTGAASSYQQASVLRTSSVIPGYATSRERVAQPGRIATDHHGDATEDQSSPAFGTPHPTGRQSDQRQSCAATDHRAEAAAGCDEVGIPRFIGIRKLLQRQCRNNQQRRCQSAHAGLLS
jgi:hypothetical protein